MILKHLHVKTLIQCVLFNYCRFRFGSSRYFPHNFSSLHCLTIRNICLTPRIKSTTKLSAMDSEKCLRELGYAFNDAGQLRKIGQNGDVTDEMFQFNISDKHQECQEHYEKIGDAVTEYIYSLLEKQENLVRLPVPAGSTPEKGTFIFASKDYDKKDRLLILIHGSGAVRAGQWARSLIINDKIDVGSQIPYIKKAIDRNFGVLILNTNDNSLPSGKKIPNSGNAEEHGLYVWEKYVSKSKASAIAIVAHSYGGLVTVTLADKLKKDFNKRVKVIAFTDSVHGFSKVKISDHLKKISRNWISSSSSLDTPMKTPDFDIPRVSAGHQQHEMTSSSCIDSVFKFIDEKVSKSCS